MRKKMLGTMRGRRESAPETSARGVSIIARWKERKLKKTIARVREMPTLLDELGPERIASLQRRAAEHPEVLGQAPPVYAARSNER